MIDQQLITKIDAIAGRYPDRKSALMPALHLVQKNSEGYISDEDLAQVAKIIGVSVAEAFGVRTYYTMYNRRPVGKYHLQVDTNIPAMLAGAEQIVEHLQQTLGIELGQTTDDGMFTLSQVEDLGSCGTCPVIQVNDRYYENMTTAKTDELLQSLRSGVMPERPDQGNFGSACDILLKHRGTADSTKIETYLADGGYQSLEKALSLEPNEVLSQVKESKIRGRGGAGFPMGLKWSFLPKGVDKPVYLICNADEGEPGTFKDRQIMEFDPHLLIEGMAISGYAIGSKVGFIYIRGEFEWIADILDAAIDEARQANKLGVDILGKGFDFEIVVHLGAGAYVCGEETALIESLEGKRGNPRLKPPFPAVEGFDGCPTIVNNVETLSNVPYILQHGPEAYLKIGVENNYGPKIFGVSGHVNKPGTYEYPLGTTLDELIEVAGGVKGNMKAVIVGGLSVPILTAEQAKGLCMDYDSCMKKGTMLGSGGIIVINDQTSIPQVALRTIKFYAHESCGQCIPCRKGSNTIKNLLTKIVQGHGKPEDIETILRLCATIKGSTLCPTGDAFAMPIEAMIKTFRSEFDALVQ
ncbi:MAG: NADH-quinone oxidoreductase subunit NuoF [Candidatus Alcyoniella australis]|nr:NADH-quinone oxidoreductase subunit NuoF [Candidatus Alcyoniella australis]